MYRISPDSNDVQSLIDCISKARISSYSNLLKASSDDEAYGFYCWNNEITSRLSLSIGTYEILLRNKIHNVLSYFFFENRKYCNGSLQGNRESCDWYNHIEYAKKVSESIQRELSDINGNLITPPPPPHQVISKLSHGNWRYILKINKTKNGKLLPWDKLLPLIFPNFIGGFSKQGKKDAVLMRMKQIHFLRNRISHFEPVWKFGDLRNEPGDIVIKKSPTDIVGILGRLKTEYKYIIDVMSFISKEAESFYLKTQNHNEINSILDMNGFESFRNKSETINIDLNSENLSKEIEELLAKRKQRNNQLNLTKDGVVIATLR